MSLNVVSGLDSRGVFASLSEMQPLSTSCGIYSVANCKFVFSMSEDLQTSPEFSTAIDSAAQSEGRSFSGMVSILSSLTFELEVFDSFDKVFLESSVSLEVS